MRTSISNQGEPSRIESFDHKTEVKIGRVASNDLVLAERGFSSNHAQLYVEPNGQLVITDIGSTNGTFVNARRLQGAHPTTLHDEVDVCHIKIETATDPVQTGRTQMASSEQGCSRPGEFCGGSKGADQSRWNHRNLHAAALPSQPRQAVLDGHPANWLS